VSGYSVIVSEKPNSSSGSADEGFGVITMAAALIESTPKVLTVNVAFDVSPVTMSPTSRDLLNPDIINVPVLELLNESTVAFKSLALTLIVSDDVN